MKALVVRINRGQVKGSNDILAIAQKGIAVFVGIDKDDREADRAVLAAKIVNLRIFPDGAGKFQYSVKDKDLDILCIPNFTLCANTAGGRRPSFEGAMEHKLADKFFADFILMLKSYKVKVAAGFFGQLMDIELKLDGPVNIVLDSRNRKYASDII